jgi:hypothetical protein
LADAELSLDAYRDWLHKGLGRAVLAVGPQHAQALRPILLDACLHNRAFAWEAVPKDNRAAWLILILRRTGDLAWYAAKVEAALPTAGDDDDGEQLAHLAALLVLEGFESLRPAVRHTLHMHPDSRDSFWFGQEEQLLIDGLDGLVRVAEVVGARLLADDKGYESDMFIEQLSRSLGREVVLHRLEREARSGAAVRRYLEVTAATRAEDDAKEAARPSGIQWMAREEIEAALLDESKKRRLRFFGCRMPEELSRSMAARIASEPDETLLLRLLYLFGRSAMPEYPERIWTLARSATPEIRYAAIAALEYSGDARKLTLARELIAADASIALSLGVLKLFGAGTAADASLILACLQAEPIADVEELHDLHAQLRRHAEAHAPVATPEPMRWAYEHGPCAMCRDDIVERLLELDALDADRREECACDAGDNVRKLVDAPPLPYADLHDD